MREQSCLISYLGAGGLAFLALVGGARAQDNASLPGGATSLNETHGDWVVTCSVQTVNGKNGKACALSQQLTDAKTGQRILAIELRPANANAEGTLALPFGLVLSKGAALQIDAGAVGVPIHFRTCLPVGCIVPIAFDSKTVAVLRNGTTVKIKTIRDGGGEMQLSVSLKGFAGALDRTALLLK